MLSNAKVEMTLADFQAMQTEKAELERRLQVLQKALDDARMGPAGSETHAFRDAFEQAMAVVRFAVGNLDPRTLRGWPYEALMAVCDHLDARPGIDAAAREAVADLRLFAREAEKWERARKDGRQHELAAAEAPALGALGG